MWWQLEEGGSDGWSCLQGSRFQSLPFSWKFHFSLLLHFQSLSSPWRFLLGWSTTRLVKKWFTFTWLALDTCCWYPQVPPLWKLRKNVVFPPCQLLPWEAQTAPALRGWCWVGFVLFCCWQHIIYITLTTNPHENVIVGYNDIMLKTKTILREQSRPFRLPHSVVLAIEETVDVWFEETRSTAASTDCLGKRQDWQEQEYQQQQKSTAGILHLMFWCKSWMFKNMMHRIPLRLAKGDSSGFLYHDPCE